MRIVLLSTMLLLKRNEKENKRERGKYRLTIRITTNTLFMLEPWYSFSSINLFGFREKFCSKCLNEI